MSISSARVSNDLDSRLNEAEVYYDQGLFAESMEVYEQVLSDTPEIDLQRKKTVKEKIVSIKNKIESETRREVAKISSEELSIIKKSLTSHKTISDILDNASAFRELSLFKEAITEYEKLFEFDYPLAKIIPELAKCMFKVYSPSKIIEQVEGKIKEQGIENEKLAEIKFILGLEMEQRGYSDMAIDMFKSAADLDPANGRIKDRLSSILKSISAGSRYDYLINKKMVTAEQLQKALMFSKKLKKSVEYVLIEQFKIKKKDVGKSLSSFYGCPFKYFNADLSTPVELIGNLKKAFLLQDLWVPLIWDKSGVQILIDDPNDLNKTDHIRALLKTKKINYSVGTKEDIEEFIRHFFQEKKIMESGVGKDGTEDFDMIPDINFEEEEEEEEEGLDEASSQVMKLVDQTLVSAYRKDASDIHIEPSPITRATNIRFRLDGVCHNYLQVPNSLARGILSRVKIMANLDIAEKRLPQDGKIKFRRKGIAPFELRVATLPTAGGFEDAVLRILPKAGAMALNQNMLSERNLKVMERIIAQPYGLILAVGPTGSGKTTTLHSALGHINKPAIKIWTAEDPIEITQAGLRQVEVKPKIGLDFARIMRSFLRADPDVIMIGEMRDFETASIGVEASLTGHLVFSTLHTNSAPETVTRLLDMGLNALNFSDAFLGVLAQRLVRRLCLDCRKEYHPSEEEFEEISTEYGREEFETLDIKYTPDLTIYRPVGCDVCSGTGYKGRMAVHELMDGSPEIKLMIKKQATTEDLLLQAKKDGMTTLRQDGIQKVFKGLTDIREVHRVCIN